MTNELEILVRLISQVGFPIVIALLLLYKFQPEIRDKMSDFDKTVQCIKSDITKELDDFHDKMSDLFNHSIDKLATRTTESNKELHTEIKSLRSCIKLQSRVILHIASKMKDCDPKLIEKLIGRLEGDE